MPHDLVVVGGGPGGYAVGFRAAVRGLDVAMVEADAVGGTERIGGADVVIATGSVPRLLPGIDVDGHVVVSSGEALRVDLIPQFLRRRQP